MTEPYAYELMRYNQSVRKITTQKDGVTIDHGPDRKLWIDPATVRFGPPVWVLGEYYDIGNEEKVGIRWSRLVVTLKQGVA